MPVSAQQHRLSSQSNTGYIVKSQYSTVQNSRDIPAVPLRLCTRYLTVLLLISMAVLTLKHSNPLIGGGGEGGGPLTMLGWLVATPTGHSAAQ